MKILTGSQIKGADAATILNEPIVSLDLMERAAEVISLWICNNIDQARALLFVVGKGNNGGDGLAVARILHNAGFDCRVKMLYGETELSEDCAANLERLPEEIVREAEEDLLVRENLVIVDAILGTGASGELSPTALKAICDINRASCEHSDITVVSLDLPSGMATEFDDANRETVMADHTLTIQLPKLAMLLPDTGERCGKIEVLDIELDAEYIDSQISPYRYITESYVRSLLLPRLKFGNKGTFGHALLICGSEGMAGAAILSAGGALRSGCGIVTVHIPRDERFALNASHPSAITSLDPRGVFSAPPQKMESYSVVGIGCGLGQDPLTAAAFKDVMVNFGRPMVIDADALNILAADRSLMEHIPAGSVLTPHPKELERIVGEWSGEEDKIGRVLELSRSTGSTVVVKGAHTMICMAKGDIFFNSTGGSGMAKGGSGDVLTGLITGLIARGYAPASAAVCGVYLHGRAGDKCSDYYGAEGMNSGDIADFIAEAMHEIE